MWIIRFNVLIATSIIFSTAFMSREVQALGHWLRCRNIFTNIECRFNNDCGSAEVCRDSKCVSACQGRKCNNNEGCQVTNHHTASCECLVGFYRGPDAKCVPTKTCIDNKNCDNTEQCNNKKCINACLNKTCGPNEGCQIINAHISSCECLPNFKRNPSGVCIENEICTSDNDCELTEICRGQCVSACFKITCSIDNEACQVNNRHSYSCHCLPGYYRNTITKECKPICVDDYTCPLHQECSIIDHVPTCQCESGFVHDVEPSDPCLKICRVDTDCDDDEKCESGKCKSACLSVKCGVDAECNAAAHIGTCSCYVGLIGDPLIGCGTACTVHDDCLDDEKCDGTKCVNACISFTCGTHSFCTATGHTPECSCDIGFRHDSAGECV